MREFTSAETELLLGPDNSESLAERFGVGATTVRRWRKSLGWTKPAATPLPIVDPEAGPSTEDLLRDEVKQLRARANRSDKQAIGDERALQAIESAVDRLRPYLPERPAYVPPVRLKDDPPHHVQLAVWSDWHYGEVVDREAMSGLSEYNVAIAEDRVQQVVRAMLSFKRVSPPLSELFIALLGDMASGMIHDLEETNEIPAAEQYVRVGQLMGHAIIELAPHYPKITLDATWGNHPRAKQNPVSKGGHNSGDWIAYHMAREITSHLPNVEWNIPRSGMVVREIAGKTFLFWHGDGVRSSMPGVPWGGVMRRLNALIATYAEIGIYIDFVVLGHYHQRAVVPHIYMNGSMIGLNEYGLQNFGGGERARQIIIEFDTKRSRETAVKTISFEEPNHG